MPQITEVVKKLTTSGRIIIPPYTEHNSLSARTILVYIRPTLNDGTLDYLYTKSPTGNGPRLYQIDAVQFTFGTESSTALRPNRASLNSTTPSLNNWHHIATTHDGGVLATAIKHYMGLSGGTIAEVSGYGSGNDGSGTLVGDAANNIYLFDRDAQDRGWQGSCAYVAVWNRVLSLAELQEAQANGPLNVPSGLVFCWANNQDYSGLSSAPTANTAARSSDAGDLPPNLNLGGLTAVQNDCVLQSSGLAAVQSDVVLQSSSDSGTSPVTSDCVLQSSGLATVQSDVVLQSSSDSVTTTLLYDFPGANANNTLSSITNATSNTPTVTIRVRSPDDAEWQQFLFGLSGVANKTVTVEILLTEKEDEPDQYRAEWQGPWWTSNRASGPAGWTNIASWSQVAGDRMTFTVSPGANDEIYLASVPPWNEETVLQWIADLETAYPTLIHDDLPSRVALNDGAYVCARSGTGTDENGRTTTNRPLLGFRVGNDALGNQPKRRIVLMSGVHSGEWNGGNQLRGFINEVLAGTYSTDLLTEFDFYVYPLHSVKGNWLGFRRNEAASSYINHLDANREWADGDTSVATVVQWQSILDTDHTVNHADKVQGFFDFHDGKHTSSQAWFYYRTGQPNATEYLSLVQAENAAITSQSSSTAGVTSQYWHEQKGVGFVWVCEVADEKSTNAQVEAFGAAYARSVKTANDAGLIAQLPTSAVTSDCVLQSSAVAAVQQDSTLQSSGLAAVQSDVVLQSSSEGALQSVTSDFVLQSSGLSAVQRDVALQSSGVGAVQSDVVLESSGLAAVQSDLVLQSSGDSNVMTVTADCVLQSSGTATVQSDTVLQSSGVVVVLRDYVLQSSGRSAVQQDVTLQSSATVYVFSDCVLQSSGEIEYADAPVGAIDRRAASNELTRPVYSELKRA